MIPTDELNRRGSPQNAYVSPTMGWTQLGNQNFLVAA